MAVCWLLLPPVLCTPLPATACCSRGMFSSPPLASAAAACCRIPPYTPPHSQDMIIMVARRGQIQEKVSEPRLIELLEQVSEQTEKKTKVGHGPHGHRRVAREAGQGCSSSGLCAWACCLRCSSTMTAEGAACNL